MNNSVIALDAADLSQLNFRADRRRAREALQVGILDAAGRLLVDEGPKGLSMRRISHEVNASTQVLYTMFGSKEGLLNALVLEGFARLAAAQEAVPSTSSHRHHLEVLSYAYLSNALTNPHYYRVMFHESVPGLTLSEATLQIGWSALNPIIRALRGGANAGEFRAEVAADAKDAAVSLWGVLHGFAGLALAGLVAEDRAALMSERAVGALLDSLAASNLDVAPPPT